MPTARPRTDRPAAPMLLLVVLALVLTACTGVESAGLPDPDDVAGTTVSGDGDAGQGSSSPPRGRFLRRSTDCDDLLQHYIAGARDLVGPWGLGGAGFGGHVVMETMAASDDSVGGADMAAALPAAAGAGGDFSTTNVQEVGVDEPDIVKTDGRVIVAVSHGMVTVTDVAAADRVATIPLPDDAWQHELLLDGTTLLILSTGGGQGGVGPLPVEGDVALVPAFGPTRTTVTRVDLGSPAQPVVQGSLRMEGAYRSARMIDGTVRMVMQSEPIGLAFTQPVDAGLAAEEQAAEANRAILEASEIDDWIPHLQVIGPDGTTGPTERILDCTDISQPTEFAGLSTLLVLTFDLRGDQLQATSGAGLVAAGDTVYASTDRLIVSTSPWGGWIQPFIDRRGGEPQDVHTDLHTFDISDPASTSHVASGRVEGTLLNSFSLSEVGGVIRVATTTRPAWLDPTGEPSQSSLVVLAEQGDSLVETGRVDGLGVTEQIYAVRYLSPDLAAVVTFRQVDPLYLIDTSDPAAPRLAGELKIPGYSAYLHPVGEGFLLGIGQDADEQTGATLGLQASLFDVRDPANPQRVQQVSLGQGYSPVEHDHRSFTFWAPTGQVMVPAELWVDQPGPQGQTDIAPIPTNGFRGAVVLQAGPGVLSVQGRVSNEAGDQPDQWFPPVQRSMVIGEDLWTLTEGSLARHDLATLAQEVVVGLTG